LRVGYFGSFAGGADGVGSDLDVVMIVSHTESSFIRRAVEWDTTDLPVPVDLIVYTKDEWKRLDRNTRFHRMLLDETVWVYNRLQNNEVE
jgi:predicted nucleotidyltransferase